MGKEIVKFSCHHCRHCCKDVVCLPTPWDVVRIIRNTGLDPNKFLEFIRPGEITDVPKSDPTWLKCGSGRFIMAIRRDEKGCYFLDKKTALCRIYDVRPILCRLFPFKLHETRTGKFKAFSLHNTVECPRHQDNVVNTKPLYEQYLIDRDNQNDYVDLVEVYNRREPARPESFIEFAIQG